MKRCITVMTVAMSITALWTGIAISKTQYSVYCANGKIEVDSRTLDQMKSARGSGTCQLKSFDYKMDADDFAKKQGGVGASCKCK